MMKSNHLGQGERWCPLCRLVGSLRRAHIFGYDSIFWALILQLIGHKLEWIVLVWQLFASFFFKSSYNALACALVTYEITYLTPTRVINHI
jgi:hypothetical protein